MKLLNLLGSNVVKMNSNTWQEHIFITHEQSRWCRWIQPWWFSSIAYNNNYEICVDRQILTCFSSKSLKF
jgi:hypothetical protein